MTAFPLPVLVSVADRAPQRRLTVGFRLIILIPHFIVLLLLTIAAAVVAFLGWWGALFRGRLPQFAHTFLSGIVRWYLRVFAYGMLLTGVYPRFSLDDDPGYPVQVAVPPGQRLNRAAVFFRLILLIPAGILAGILSYGAGTLLGIVAWLATLVAGRLPAAYHQAYSAVLRFQARYWGYALMLTPAYPGRLFGDTPGPPACPPASWLLVLPAAAKRLLTGFIVVGAILSVASIAYQASRVSRADNAALAQNALSVMDTSYGNLTSNLTNWNDQVETCNSNVTCVTGLDANAAGYFTAFESQLTATAMPSNSVAAAARLSQVATASAQDFTELSRVTTEAQYQSVVTSTNLVAALNDFDSDYNALVKALESD